VKIDELIEMLRRERDEHGPVEVTNVVGVPVSGVYWGPVEEDGGPGPAVYLTFGYQGPTA
jgi:hypothetical protein